MKKISIIGCNGMLGRCLYENFKKTDIDVIGFTHKDLDVCDYGTICSVIPYDVECVINCAAITDTSFCGRNDGMISSFL